MAVTFPFPIIFALLLNEVRSKVFQRSIQTITYLPHFISTVVICGLLVTFSAKDGLFNIILEFFGHQRSDLLMSNSAFLPIYLSSDVWTSFGWGSIIYFSALAGVDQEQYEAAYVDGAGRFKRMWHITLPGILPTIMLVTIMNLPNVLNAGFDQIFNLYNPLVMETADIIDTWVYRVGLVERQYSLGTAVGLLRSIVGIILMLSANKIAQKVTDYRIF